MSPAVRLGVNVIAATAGAARESAAVTMNAVLKAVLAQGVARRDVRTSLVSLNPTMDYSAKAGPARDRLPGSEQRFGHAAQPRQDRRSHRRGTGRAARRRSTRSTSAWAIPTRATEQARTAAMDDAQARATTLARAAGQKLGDVVAVVEGSPMSPPMPFPAARMAMKAADASTPVESGTQEISVFLTVTFDLRS